MRISAEPAEIINSSCYTRDAEMRSNVREDETGPLQTVKGSHNSDYVVAFLITEAISKLVMSYLVASYFHKKRYFFDARSFENTNS